MEEQKNNASQEEQKDDTSEPKAPTGGSRNAIYAVIILLAIIVVAWTIYVQLLFKKANSLTLEGKNDEAAKTLKTLRSTSFGFQVNRKELAKVYLDLARGFATQSRPDNAQAKKLCRDAVSLCKDPEVFLDALRVVMDLPQPDYALCEELGQKIIEMSKDPADAHLELSRVYYEQQRYEDAVKQLDKYLALRPNDKTQQKLRKSYEYFVTHKKASKMLDAGMKLQEQGKLDEAIASYKETAKKYPKFRFVARHAVKAYLQKYDQLSDEAKKSEGENLLNNALDILDGRSLSDSLNAALGTTEEIKKKKAGYKITALTLRLEDLDKGLEECEKYAAANPDDKVDGLLKAIKTEIRIKKQVESRMGDEIQTGGAPHQPGGGKGADAGSFRERFKHTIELVQLVRKLPKLDAEAKVAISAEQTAKLLPVLREIQSAEKLPQKDAEAKVTAIKGILSEAQLAALEKIELPRRGGPGGGGPTAAMPAAPRGGAARPAPDANPFKSERRKAALADLIELLEKKTPKE